MKISVIGAGNVGATVAMRALEAGLGDVALIDIVDGLAKGKALDIADASPIIGHENKITGTNDFSEINGSSIVVITAGLARKPGMTREELSCRNAQIVKDISLSIKKLAPGAIVIIVTNPLDVMSYYVYKLTGFPKSKIIGMAGTLDASRFRNLISDETKIPRSKIETYVMGCHGDTMVPLVSKTYVNKKPLRGALNKDILDRIVERTRARGAEIVSYLKSGSAYYSPSAGVFEILKAIKDDSGKVLCVSAYLDGEYGIKGCFLGVPAKIGKSGIEKIVDLKIDRDESEALRLSAEKTKKEVASLDI